TEAEAGPASGLRLDPHIAAVLHDGLPSQGQTKSQSVALAGGDERLEELRADFGCNAGPVVCHMHDCCAIFYGRGDPDFATIRHRFERVRDEVEKGALHPAALQGHFDLRRDIEHDRDALRLRPRRKGIACGGSYLAEAAEFGGAALA